MNAQPICDPHQDRAFDVHGVLGSPVAFGAGRRTNRAETDGFHPVGAHEFIQSRLLEVRVDLHLVDRRLNSRVPEQGLSFGIVMFDVPMCRTSPMSTNFSIWRHVFMKWSWM